MDDWSRQIGKVLHRTVAIGEEVLDSGRKILSDRLCKGVPGFIATYGGYADATGTHFMGRVLERAPGGGPMDHDSLWDNLGNTLRRWETDEVTGVKIHLTFRGLDQEFVSDEEGYYHVTFPGLKADQFWSTADARIIVGDGEIRGTHQILTPQENAEFGIISDLDDTVIHTGITSILLAAKLTFLENAKTRKPLDGVAELYSALQKGITGNPVNPIFYVSSSPWNLHDLLLDFMILNEIPRGPIFLRDVGLDRTKFIKTKGHGHKQDRALQLLDGYPDMPFILIGDSGQEDPAIYAEICQLRPGRVLAIYIRDVDPDTDSEWDNAVHKAVELAAQHNVPMILAPNSLAMSHHASKSGLIPPEVIPEVVTEIQKDENRPETGEQAVQDAAKSLAPEK